MFYLLMICIGACIGSVLRHQTSLLRPVPTLTLMLLLTLIFLMGSSLDLQMLTTALVLRAVGLCLASIIGSVLCLTILRFFFRTHDT